MVLIPVNCIKDFLEIIYSSTNLNLLKKSFDYLVEFESSLIKKNLPEKFYYTKCVSYFSYDVPTLKKSNSFSKNNLQKWVNLSWEIIS